MGGRDCRENGQYGEKEILESSLHIKPLSMLVQNGIVGLLSIDSGNYPYNLMYDQAGKSLFFVKLSCVIVLYGQTDGHTFLPVIYCKSGIPVLMYQERMAIRMS